jgi:hypothetical protein
LIIGGFFPQKRKVVARTFQGKRKRGENVYSLFGRKIFGA